jgi:cytochrome c-type biogenesis protein CcmH
VTGSSAVLVFALLAFTLALAFGASLYWAGGRGQSRWLAIAAPLVIAGLYAWRGEPKAFDPPAPPPQQQAHNVAEMSATVQKLVEYLQDHPEDLDGWLLLARSYTMLGRYGDAAAAYEHAQERVMQDSDLLTRWIQLRLIVNDRKFDARTHELVARAAELAPDDTGVLLLRAIAAHDRGDQASADALIAKLHERYPPGDPDRQSLDETLEDWMQQGKPAKP